jgi:large subunit ribosomal protein L4
MAETTVKLNQAIFGLKVENHELLKVAYDAYLANSRLANAKTLKRGEVRGGGKKPWRQKGTGRARFGSTRNPIWRHGGVAFGPTGDQNFVKKLSQASKQVALRQALSLANQAKKIKLAPDFAPKTGKTTEAVKYLEANQAAGNTLLVVTEKTDLVLRSTNNIANLIVSRPTYLNVYNILNADTILIAEGALAPIDEWLGGKK